MFSCTKSSVLCVTLASLAGIVSSAVAQTPCPLPDNCVTNPSFETLDPRSLAGDPLGWHNLSNPNESKRRVFGDALSPAAPMGKTGVATVMLATPGSSEFRGMTSDWRNCALPNCPFYDPPFNWDGGDVVVTAWYYIPSDNPITGDLSFLKLNVKRGNQDYAAYDPPGEGTPDQLIQGHTGDQWLPYTIRWPIADIKAEVQFNADEGYFNLPPYPDHLKITLSRFGFGNAPSSGVIFWDDINFIQEAPPSECGCAADYNQDGGVTGDDVGAFFGDFEQSGACADVNQDGGVDGADVEAFFLLFEAGSC